MLKRIGITTLAVAAFVVVGATSAVANKGLGPPAWSDSTLSSSPSPVDSASTNVLTFTFTLASTPSTIDGGALEIEAPAGWTFDTDGAIDNSSTCDVSAATASSGGSVADVSGVSCTTGQTIVVTVSATAPTVTDSTDYVFESSIKQSPGPRRTHPVYRVPGATETVNPAV
jgi:hypothetical protein